MYIQQLIQISNSSIMKYGDGISMIWGNIDTSNTQYSKYSLPVLILIAVWDRFALWNLIDEFRALRKKREKYSYVNLKCVITVHGIYSECRMRLQKQTLSWFWCRDVMWLLSWLRLSATKWHMPHLKGMSAKCALRCILRMSQDRKSSLQTWR